MIAIRVLDQTLTDGSLTFDVTVVDHQTGHGLTFPAVTYEDAISLGEKIATALRAHTNEEVSIWRFATDADLPSVKGLVSTQRPYWDAPVGGGPDDEAPF